MKPITNVVTTAARKAGRLIVQAQADIASIKVSRKEDSTLVSDIDVAVEKSIIDSIKKAGYDDFFITEESGEFGNRDSDFTWIIDPIDGTNNFIHGLPQCCISIALRKNDDVILGVIYNPFLDLMFTAFKGKGAQLNGKRIRVANRLDFAGALFSVSLKYSRQTFNDSYIAEIIKLHRSISGYRYSGSIALDLAYVAAGYLDGLWTANKVKVWDVAAGYLIAKEAGAIVTDIKGSSNIDDADFIIAANKKLQPKIARILAKHVKK